MAEWPSTLRARCPHDDGGPAHLAADVRLPLAAATPRGEVLADCVLVWVCCDDKTVAGI